MRSVITTIIVFFAISLNAQEDNRQEFIIPENKTDLIPGTLEPSTSNSRPEMEYNQLLPKSLMTPHYFQSDLNFNGNIYDLKRNISYMLYSNNDILHGFGSSYEAGGLLIYQPFDNLTFTIGASVAQYSINGNSYDDFLFNSSMTYQFNNWLKLYIYGQYSMNSQKNALAGGYYLSPQNCYGAIFMIKVLDNKRYSIDMNIGAGRSYNPLDKNWEMNYRLGPEIRLK